MAKTQQKIMPYQQKINNAAIQLALNDSDLLSRQKLLEVFRIKVYEG